MRAGVGPGAVVIVARIISRTLAPACEFVCGDVQLCVVVCGA